MVNLERLPSDLKKQIIQKEGAKKKIEEKTTSLKSIKKTSQSWRTCAYRLTESTECLAELLKKYTGPLQGTLLSHFKVLLTKR